MEICSELQALPAIQIDTSVLILDSSENFVISGISQVSRWSYSQYIWSLINLMTRLCNRSIKKEKGYEHC